MYEGENLLGPGNNTHLFTALYVFEHVYANVRLDWTLEGVMR